MPLVILEGFAAGVPCVATDVGSCKDLIEGGLNEDDKRIGLAGAITGIANPEALAQEYIKFLSFENGYWAEAQKNALNRVQKYYKQEVVDRPAYGAFYGKKANLNMEALLVTEEARKILTAEFDNNAPEVKTFGANSQIKVTTKYLIEEDGVEVDGIIQQKLHNGLKGMYTEEIKYYDFSSDVEGENKMLGILSSQKIGPTIAYDIRTKAYFAIFFALIIIFIYIAARFKKWQFGLAGVAALFHDTLITMGLFSIFYGVLPFSMEIDQAFIAAILTIIGYSINDTVIIFDRIRENTSLFPKHSIKSNINIGLNSTLARTLNTSGTTLVVLLVIFIFGGEVIRGFIFALLIGVLVGTYSSLFTASPIAYDLLGGDKQEKEVAEIKSLMENKLDKEEVREIEAVLPEIEFGDFTKIDIRVGKILECEKMKKAKKLLVSKFDTGDKVRNIVSGIAEYYEPSDLVGKLVQVVVNLKPAKLRGELSEGMVLCGENDKKELFVIEAPDALLPGDKIS